MIKDFPNITMMLIDGTLLDFKDLLQFLYLCEEIRFSLQVYQRYSY